MYKGPVQEHMTDNAISREVTELSLLFEISKKLGESLDLKAVLKPILQMVAEYMQIPRGTLTILNRSKGEIAIEEAYGLKPGRTGKGQVPHRGGHHRQGYRYRTTGHYPQDLRGASFPR